MVYVWLCSDPHNFADGVNIWDMAKVMKYQRKRVFFSVLSHCSVVSNSSFNSFTPSKMHARTHNIFCVQGECSCIHQRRLLSLLSSRMNFQSLRWTAIKKHPVHVANTFSLLRKVLPSHFVFPYKCYYMYKIYIYIYLSRCVCHLVFIHFLLISYCQLCVYISNLFSWAITFCVCVRSLFCFRFYFGVVIGGNVVCSVEWQRQR